MKRATIFCMAAAISALASSAALASNSTYISLGDSLAFGFTTLSDGPFPNNGDRGYVGPYADWLATQRGGDRPNVINLAIPGESSVSYYNTSQAFRAANTNYTGVNLSQSQLFHQTVAAQTSLGNTIDTITISLGPNDFLSVASQPDFLTLPATQQLQILGDTLNTLAGNYLAIAAEARAAAPNANIIIVGDYNPYAILPQSPLYPFAGVLIDNINQIGQAAAAGVGGRFVDTAHAFIGHEAEYTHILDDPFPNENIHPTTLGYRVIADLIIVPGPGGLGVMAVTMLAATARRRRTRTHAAHEQWSQVRT